MPDVTIWCADGEPLAGCSYATRVRSRLEAAFDTIAVVPVSRRVPDDQELAAPCHVLTGGATSALSDRPWMVAVRERLELLLRSPARVVGICLGSQLLAVSLGGTCGHSRAGLEIGLSHIAEVEAEPRGVCAAQFHYHEIHPSVLDVPDVVHRFRNEHSFVQGFDHGRRHRALQFHPEFDPTDAAALISRHPGLLAEHGLDPRTALRHSDEAAPSWSPDTFDRLVTGFLLES